MGLVKFGSQTLAIEQIPDGHIVISENELASLRQVQNVYLTLKSRIPVGIGDADISSLIEKGQRYDGLNVELGSTKTQLTQATGQLEQRKNIPADFTVDKWTGLVNAENKRARDTKVTELHAAALKRAEEKTGVKGIKVDLRFADSAAMAALDVNAADAVDKMYAILDNAHTAQLNFYQEMSQGHIPIPEAIGTPGAAVDVGATGSIDGQGQIRVKGL